MNRRGFLAAMLAAGAAPAIVRAQSLMPIKVPAIIVPTVKIWRPTPYIRPGDVISIDGLLAPGAQLFTVSSVVSDSFFELNAELKADIERVIAWR